MTNVVATVVRIVSALVLVCASFVFAFAADPVSADSAAEIQKAIPSAEKNYIAPNFLVIAEQTKPKPAPKPVIDTKFIAMSAVSMALTIADIERTQHCLRRSSCVELDPLLPRSRAGMYAVNIPVNAGLMYLSYRLKASGRKTWWIAPLSISAGHFVGATFRF